jgi:hypothetical protein
VHSIGIGKSVLVVYQAGTADSSANSVCVFLFVYITHNILAHVQELYLFSFACVEQNKNHMVIQLCIILVDNSMSHYIQQFFFFCQGTPLTGIFGF